MQKYGKDLTGIRNGDIEILRRVGSEKGYSLWECKCHRCGGTFVASYRRLFLYHSNYPKGSDKSIKCCFDCMKKEAGVGNRKRPHSGNQGNSNNSWRSYCAECGKGFGTLLFDMTQYAYKRGNKVFCSWKCMRAYDKKWGDPKYNILK